MNDKQYIRIAEIVAESSKCVSLQVGAVIVMDGRIISTGYNGTPPKYLNCDEVHSCRGEKHTAWSLKYEIHAEQNAISFAARNGVTTNGSTMYVTIEPCFSCLKTIASAGIVRVVFGDHYYNELDGSSEKIDFAKHCGIELVRVDHE